MLTKHLNIYLSRQISVLPAPNEVWHYEAGRIEAVEIESPATEKHLSLSLTQMEKVPRGRDLRNVGFFA
jgi:hypothetical protein